MSDIERFADRFVREIRDGNAAIFAGAGLSIPAGMVDWRGLMRDIAADVSLNVDQETDLVTVAQYHVNERGGRHQINDALVEKFAQRAELTRNHAILAGLPIRTYWTTNYDTLLEDALRAAKKRVDVKHTDKNLTYTLRQRDVVVYKMHGDVSQPDDAVVTRDDYERYAARRPMLASALQGDLVSKTFLFLGFSFSDPNLSYVLSRIRNLLGEHRHEHYSLMRRVHRDDFGTDDEYKYARVRQELQLRDLRRFGIQDVLVDSYDDYTAVLKSLADRYKRQRVFVSGSAATFSPFGESDGQNLLRAVGRAIIESGFDLVSGFGSGFGPFLLNGALEGLLEDAGTSAINYRLVLRPFPQGIADPAERVARWRSYRRAMIAEAGVAVFLFGNKVGADGLIVPADGVREEFEMAREAGLAVVPVGATGHIAAEVQAVVLSDFGSYYPQQAELQGQLEALGAATDVTTIVERLEVVLTSILRGQ
jgi:hypothetical protein